MSFDFCFKFTSLDSFVNCTRSCCDYKLIIRLKFPNTSSQLYFCVHDNGFGIICGGAYTPCIVQLPIESVLSDQTDYQFDQFG